MPAIKPLPPLELLRERIAYDPETGALTWKCSRNKNGKTKAGSTVGCLDSRGYVVLHFDHVIYLGHRIAWALYYGEDPGNMTIDHIDQDKSNNRINNLRLATPSNQMLNIDNKNNKSGCRGVHFHKTNKRWVAAITVQYKSIHLGSFKTFEEAVEARLKAEQELGVADFSSNKKARGQAPSRE